jgi:hypothetical protein
LTREEQFSYNKEIKLKIFLYTFTTDMSRIVDISLEE